MSGQTLFDKIWDSHVVRAEPDGTTLLYIDRQLVHEVTSPQAFEGLKLAGRRPRRPGATLAVPDHNVPTTDRRLGIADPVSAIQIQTLEDNCRDFGITLFNMNDIRQGIVHVIGPEQGFTLPGTTIVCGDSHTSTHGAFGALGLRHRHQRSRARAGDPVLGAEATQDDGNPGRRCAVGPLLGEGRHPGDHRQDRHGRRHRLRHRIHRLGDSRAQHGRAHDALQHVDRRRRAGRHGRTGREDDRLSSRAVRWRRPATPVRSGRTGLAATQDRCRTPPTTRPSSCKAEDIAPQVSWGTSPGMVTGVDARVPDPKVISDEKTRQATEQRSAIHGPHRQHAHHRHRHRPGLHRLLHELTHRGLTACRQPGQRQAHVAKTVRAMVVPGSGLIKQQAEAEGLDRVFTEAGFEWREAGLQYVPGHECRCAPTR